MAQKRRTSSIKGHGPEIAALRQSLGLGQIAFASSLDVDQSTLAKWEKNQRDVPLAIFLKVVELVGVEERAQWMDWAGMPTPPTTADHGTVRIPVLRDAAAAGTPRALDEKEHEGEVVFPHSWFVGAGRCFIVPVKGSSMEPVIFDGSRVVIDTAKRSIGEFVNWLVLARVDDGVTVKLLQRSGETYLLTPLNPNADNAPSLLPRESSGIVGRVLHILNEPAAWRGSATSKRLRGE